MNITAIGYNYSHGREFVMDRPNGSESWIMLLIKTPGLFTVNGNTENVKPNSFILFSPETPYKYYGTEDVYTDDWVYFDMDENDLRLLDKLGIECDKPLFLGNIEELSGIIHILSYEHFSAERYNTDIEKYYTEILLRKLSRLILSGASVSLHLYTEKNSRMTQLRTMILLHPEENMSVNEMADAMSMSRSGFQHLYKRMFGVSVIKDITRGRMERAKKLLSSTNLTIAEISNKCGYISEYSFMRKFKEESGKTPTEFRNCI
ncbi:MAG: AraC family transcriptional regulator [Oscillospiraceae bacterium]|nr:AraC family transcriptional regulator [Oscillospiraceae bacterium]